MVKSSPTPPPMAAAVAVVAVGAVVAQGSVPLTAMATPPLTGLLPKRTPSAKLIRVVVAAVVSVPESGNECESRVGEGTTAPTAGAGGVRGVPNMGLEAYRP